MDKRKKPTPRERAQCFQDHEGKCHICGRKITIGEPWDVEHVQALSLLGKDDPSNWAPAHVDCHRGKGGKTSQDRAMLAKAERVRLKHLGLWESKYPMRKKPKGVWAKLVDLTETMIVGGKDDDDGK